MCPFLFSCVCYLLIQQIAQQYPKLTVAYLIVLGSILLGFVYILFDLCCGKAPAPRRPSTPAPVAPVADADTAGAATEAKKDK